MPRDTVPVSSPDSYLQQRVEIDGTLAPVGIAPFSYLASPYSRYPRGTDAAYADVCELAARLFKIGIPVYSPIAHTHGIGKAGGLDGGFEAWRSFDEALIAGSSGVLVAQLEGWRDSAGIAAEIVIAKRLGKPVRYVDQYLNVTGG